MREGIGYWTHVQENYFAKIFDLHKNFLNFKNHMSKYTHIRHNNSYIIDSNCISVNLYAPLDDMKTVYYTILLSWSVVSVTVYRSYFDDFNHTGMNIFIQYITGNFT